MLVATLKGGGQLPMKPCSPRVSREYLTHISLWQPFWSDQSESLLIILHTSTPIPYSYYLVVAH